MRLLYDGDQINYTYEGSASTDNNSSRPINGRSWAARGKHKGIKGSGTCAGKQNADARATGSGPYPSMGMDKMEKMR